MPVVLSPAARDPGRRLADRPRLLAVWSVVAAFGTYACMYGLRKPFTAAGYEGPPFGPGTKALLVTAQVLGYTLSKWIGIQFIAGLQPGRRLATLLGLVGAAEVALILFGLAPAPLGPVFLFLNGLALGLVFGLVLGFLEGRRMTEALVAGLCASFIVADGFTKTAGAILLSAGVTERWMPAVAGGLFLLPLLGFAAMLGRIPEPSPADVVARARRVPLDRAARRAFLVRHGPGLGAIVLAYLVITVLRSLRADFAPELWAALGTSGQPAVFTQSEVVVALGILAVNALVCGIRDNRRAFLASLGISGAGLILLGLALAAQRAGHLGPLPFMVLFGLGLYLPYVAVHTTVFERLIALTRDRGNVGHLMYLADAMGYLGYVAVMLGRRHGLGGDDLWPAFQVLSVLGAGLALVCFGVAALFFNNLRSPAAAFPEAGTGPGASRSPGSVRSPTGPPSACPPGSIHPR